jgi:hypothetical protein
MSAEQWFLLDEAGDEVLIMMPDRRVVRGRVVGNWELEDLPTTSAGADAREG